MPSVRRRTVLASITSTSLPFLTGCARLAGDDTDGSENDDYNDDGDADGGENDRSKEDEREREETSEDETTTDAAITLVETLADGRFIRAHEQFAPTARDHLEVGQLERIWMGYTAVGGEFREIVDTVETTDSGLDAVDLTMSFARGTHVLRLLVTEELKPAGLFFNGTYERASYADSDAFLEQDTALETADCPLAGRVTLPTDADTDSVPGVVLVHGSGPADMDLENVATAAFRDLAEGLATGGIATLRYDKRTYACPVAPADHTLDYVTVDDALVAVDELRRVDAVDSDRIVVAGLSMGGLAAPQIAARDGDLSGIVAMAAPARPFYELVLEQQAHHATVGEHDWEEARTQYEAWSAELDSVRDGDYADDDTVFGLPGTLVSSLETYDHLETAAEIDVPAYFLQGERDYQVSVDDLERWRDVLEDQSGASFTTYDGLNHLFMPGTGPSVMYEYFVRNNVDRRVLDDVSEWVLDL